MGGKAGGAAPPGAAVLPFGGEELWNWPAAGLLLLGAGIILRVLASSAQRRGHP